MPIIEPAAGDRAPGIPLDPHGARGGLVMFSRQP
jgi:hypothetical protein